jgi:hypothetical protein
MIKVSVLYPNAAGTKFDMAYYLNHHIPMVLRLVGSALKEVSVCHDRSPSVRLCGSISEELRQTCAGNHGRHPKVHELSAAYSDR